MSIEYKLCIHCMWLINSSLHFKSFADVTMTDKLDQKCTFSHLTYNVLKYRVIPVQDEYDIDRFHWMTKCINNHVRLMADHWSIPVTFSHSPGFRYFMFLFTHYVPFKDLYANLNCIQWITSLSIYQHICKINFATDLWSIFANLVHKDMTNA